jgi:hypothetical protein
MEANANTGIDDNLGGVDDTNEEENENELDATIWDGGPPVPPDPDMVINDISCQGTVAMALHEALDELQQQHTLKSLQEKYNFRFDSQKVMCAFGESIAQQQHYQYDAQLDDAMKQQPLQQAQPQQQQKKQRNDPTATLTRNIKNSHHRSTNTSEDTESIVAPAAMLRGRMDHYNRYGTKWRIVVDDVEIRPRRPIDAQQLRKMKRDRTMSLWSIVSPPHPPNTTEENMVPIKIPRLEILVYNDIE